MSSKIQKDFRQHLYSTFLWTLSNVFLDTVSLSVISLPCFVKTLHYSFPFHVSFIITALLPLESWKGRDTRSLQHSRVLLNRSCNYESPLPWVSDISSWGRVLAEGDAQRERHRSDLRTSHSSFNHQPLLWVEGYYTTRRQRNSFLFFYSLSLSLSSSLHCHPHSLCHLFL